MAKPKNNPINSIFLVPELKLLETTQTNSWKSVTPAISIKKDKENHKNEEPITVYKTKYLTALNLFNLDPCSIVYTKRGNNIASKAIKNKKISLTVKQIQRSTMITSRNRL